MYVCIRKCITCEFLQPKQSRVTTNSGGQELLLLEIFRKLLQNREFGSTEYLAETVKTLICHHWQN